MPQYNFTLKFALPQGESDSDALLERLYSAGCDDALVGTGLQGRLALQFTRESPTGAEAVHSAIDDVLRAAPEAVLAEAGPDYVGLTEIAALIGCSRQNMRKLMLSHSHGFPFPVHEGTTSLWHLADVLSWFQAARQRQCDPKLLEVALICKAINAQRQLSRSLAMPGQMAVMDKTGALTRTVR